MPCPPESEELSEAVVGSAEDELPEVGAAESVTTRRPESTGCDLMNFASIMITLWKKEIQLP